MTIVEAARAVTGGVDTHLDVHVAAALNPVGALLGSESFATTPAGYAQLLSWLEGFGSVTKVGVEGTGAYGAGLSRFLRRRGVEVVEVDRPNRQARRRQGKSDPLDAVEAARAALSGRAQGHSKSRRRFGGGHPGLGRRQEISYPGPHEGHHPDAPPGLHRA
jgi:transposase